MDNLRIKADYPDGFTFSTSDPKSFEGNNTWYLGHLVSRRKRKNYDFGKTGRQQG